jgi:phosphatidylglycerophosphate synthase
VTGAQWALVAIGVVVLATLLDWLDGWMVRRARRRAAEEIADDCERAGRDER